MSTGLNCAFLSTAGKHYYLLESYDAPRNAYDWHEFATAYGPFASAGAAERHLGANHANPGGWTDYGEIAEPDATLARALSKAHRSRRSPRRFSF